MAALVHAHTRLLRELPADDARRAWQESRDMGAIYLRFQQAREEQKFWFCLYLGYIRSFLLSAVERRVVVVLSSAFSTARESPCVCLPVSAFGSKSPSRVAVSLKLAEVLGKG